MPRGRGVAIQALAESPAASQSWSREIIHALIDRYARERGVDPRLAHAVVRVESNYQPLAVSPRGAMGLMQIMPVVAREYGVQDPFDPEQNLDAGLRHLRRLLGRFDVRRALAAYNAGESVVVRYGGVPPYRETQSYVQRILAAVR
ncbi:MAG: lytic transglycosylase domain-containing protein [Planctomycetes bacterium]|nr:lytic transglycosylase domain-containing protein [Planctomycetota bacterium]